MRSRVAVEVRAVTSHEFLLGRRSHGYDGRGGGVFHLRRDVPARQHQLQQVAVVVTVRTRHLTLTRVMDHQSGQGFDSDDSDLDIQVEISRRLGKVEDGFPKDMELCAGEEDKFIEQSVADISADGEALEPFIGMEFNSREEARELYIAYGNVAK
ncbi:hypothetical protein Ahy_A08g039051 [Arachis hypogaea]|uniref:Uncharacterized protein n=1 Tax=Arachis hypogaea TaxID=3818 RepID=A0A445BVI3_ARAHY|nr:hypothetical protein Ahy_A08g039051 [Arachis hypogaea]